MVVLADAFLALASVAVVLADARPDALIPPASLAVVLADARPDALLAPSSLAVAFADARPAAWLALASLAVVRELSAPLLHSVHQASCPPDHSISLPDALSLP